MPDKKEDEGQQRPPAFQFYCRDWLTSEKVMAMSDKGVRVYMNLLAQAWLSTPIGTLPTDDALLWRFSGVTKQGWNAVKKEVVACFEVRGNRLASPPLCTQARSLKNKGISRSEAGKKGAAGRWKSYDNQSSGDANAIVLPLANDGTAVASASASAKQPPPPPLGGTATDLDSNGKKSGPKRPDDDWIADVNFCGGCQFPYKDGENADTHSCSRTLKAAGMI